MNSEQAFDNKLNPQPEPPAPQSFFNRLIGVYFSPGDTFKEIGLAPNTVASPALLVAVSVVTGGSFGAMFVGSIDYAIFVWLGLTLGLPLSAGIGALLGTFITALLLRRGNVSILGMPIFVLLLLTIIFTLIVFNRLPIERAMNQRVNQAVESGQITAEQAEPQREFLKKLTPIIKFSAPLIAPIAVIIIALVIAGLAKLISSMMGIENTFVPIFAITLYTTLAVSIASSVITIILIFLKPVDEIDMNNPVATNLAAIMSLLNVTGLPKFVSTFLSYLDIFFIWKVVLLGIGYSAVSHKLKTSTAIAYVSCVGLFVALIHSGWSAIFG